MMEDLYSYGVEVLHAPPLESAYVKEGVPSRNYKNQDIEVNWDFGNFVETVGLIKFDLRDVPSELLITAAKLRLFCRGLTGQYNEGYTTVYRYDYPWNESTVTYNQIAETWWYGNVYRVAEHKQVLPGDVNQWVEVVFNELGLQWLNEGRGSVVSMIVPPYYPNFSFNIVYDSTRGVYPPQLELTCEADGDGNGDGNGNGENGGKGLGVELLVAGAGLAILLYSLSRRR